MLVNEMTLEGHLKNGSRAKQFIHVLICGENQRMYPNPEFSGRILIDNQMTSYLLELSAAFLQSPKLRF